MTGAPALASWRDVVLGAPDAWWLGWAPEKAVVFTPRIGQAVFAGWDIKGGLMTVHRWSPENGCTMASRPYP